MKEKYRKKYRDSGLAKEWQLKHRYGLPIGGWAKMAAEQNDTCAACGLPFGGRTIAVDHDHKTGVIRGLIHRQCNSMIGLANESATTLERAAAYLRKHQGNLK